MGGSPPGSAGVPPAQILPQLRPSPPPESTGSGALPLLRPGPCGSRRQGGRLQHRRETERQPKGTAWGGNIAGKLSGNRRDSMRAGRPRSRGCRPDGEVGGIRRATSLKAGLSPLGNSRLPASRAPAPRDWADHTRVKQVLFQVSRAPAPTTVRITQRENSRSSMKTNHQ